MYCPRCGTMSPDDANFCIGCGSRISAGASIAPERRNYDVLQESSGDLFLYIPTARLALLSIVSGHLYEVYWMYKNWSALKEKRGLPVRPFWRAVFGVFFCSSLLEKIHADSDLRKYAEPGFSSKKLAAGWITMIILSNLLSRLPGVWGLALSAAIPSWLCLLPVQNYVNEATRKRSPAAAYHGWAAGHIVCLVVGIASWLVGLLVI